MRVYRLHRWGARRHLCCPRRAVLPGDRVCLGMPSSPHKGAPAARRSWAALVTDTVAEPPGEGRARAREIHLLCESPGLSPCFAVWTPSLGNGENAGASSPALRLQAPCLRLPPRASPSVPGTGGGDGTENLGAEPFLLSLKFLPV